MTHGKNINSNQMSLFATEYCHDMDTLIELKDEILNYLQNIIVVLLWVINIFRVGISTQVYILLRHLQFPQ